MGTSKCVAFIILALLTTFIACLTIIPERANIDYLNPKFVKDADFSVVRYGRRSKYYVNLSGTILHTWDNNVTINCLFYEYLHNEYRRSFVEMHYKLCELVNSDPYLGKQLQNAGLKCPVTSGKWALKNMTTPTENFDMVWPFKKSRMDISIASSTGESMARAVIYLLFVDDRGKKHQAAGKLMGG